ncbi:MAG: transcriptional regulator [Frondihabitans sp.]|nr:transcriptional regulator [Frondihabitans sp.]
MANHLGEYLRARREGLHPADVGLPTTPRRRVAGLRREEAAMLAGISTEYYLRLEQGRDSRPSPAVVDGLARALQLDDEAAAYLRALANPAQDPRRKSPRRLASVSPGLVRLIDTWPTPAYIHDRLQRVVAANPLARALSPGFQVGTNALLAFFTAPELRELYGDGWDSTARKSIAGLRAMIGPDVEDPALAGLVGELSLRSADFRRLWARQEVRTKGAGETVLHHPVVGDLTLSYEKLAVAGGDGCVLVIYHADPGSESEVRLSLLGGSAPTFSAASPHASRTTRG